MRKFLRELIVRFFEDLIPTRAASLAFTTLLSIVPLFIFIFYLLTFFPALTNASQELERIIFTHFVASSATQILNHLHEFVANVHHLSWINIMALGFIALLLIYNVVGAINGVWRVQMTGFSAIAMFVYWVVLGILPIFFAFLLLLSSYLVSLPFLLKITQFSALQKMFIVLFPFLVEWIAFSLFHYLTPSCKVLWRFAVIAGLVTTIAFDLAKWGFVQYIHYFPTYQLFYGALAVIPIFFVWVFLVWMIMITGALICHLLQKKAEI